jgi:hypothetical protein
MRHSRALQLRASTIRAAFASRRSPVVTLNHGDASTRAAAPRRSHQNMWGGCGLPRRALDLGHALLEQPMSGQRNDRVAAQHRRCGAGAGPLRPLALRIGLSGGWMHALGLGIVGVGQGARPSRLVLNRHHPTGQVHRLAGFTTPGGSDVGVPLAMQRCHLVPCTRAHPSVERRVEQALVQAVLGQALNRMSALTRRQKPPPQGPHHGRQPPSPALLVRGSVTA